MSERQPRLLSFTEISTAMTCFAQWDFAYGGRLAGSTLRAKGIAPQLSDGRAWGAAVAAWHANSGTLLASWAAHEALRASLDKDAAEMEKNGWPVSFDERMETENNLSAILDHYMTTSTPLPNLTSLEGEIVVPVPSRGGARGSTRYRFQCFLDGATEEDGVGHQIVEFKLRGGLTPVPLIHKQRQPRWYAWAYMKAYGRPPAGVLIDERLKEAPKPPRTLKAKKKGDGIDGRIPSHAKDQLCTPESYVDLCHEHGVEPHWDIVEHLGQRLWQQRVLLSLRPGELTAAGEELRDSAKLIRDLDSGELTPIRNASRMHCGGCKYRDVCAEPSDELFVDTLFERTVPKRLRPPREKVVA